ncbi:hypothetical protein HYZ76_02365, partial [Candidatus Falkowbacteria bacterium]|nr:hypothetical protein [Candidatus Falkowbacteria bacterium]
SIFTPVKNVGFKIENVRVGQMTNYENLTLTIQTDGTISPEEALKSANQILIQHFNFIDQDVKSEEKPKKTRKEKGKEEEGEEKEEDKEEKIKAEDKKEEKEKKKAERKAKKEKKAEAEEKKETEE